MAAGDLPTTVRDRLHNGVELLRHPEKAEIVWVTAVHGAAFTAERAEIRLPIYEIYVVVSGSACVLIRLQDNIAAQVRFGGVFKEIRTRAE